MVHGPANLISRRTRILVVEDEALVREVAVDMLREEGFDVEQADSASRALTMLAEAPFDLLFTDIRMPGMNGIELGRTARRSYPALKIVYASGYAGDATAEEPLAILLKPYRLATMVARIAEELATPAAVPSSSTTVMQLLSRGEKLRARLDQERAIGEARRRDVRASVSMSSHTRQMIAGQRMGTAVAEPRFLAFYARWFALPQIRYEPASLERAVALDIGAAGLTLWCKEMAGFACRFCGEEVDLQFGGNVAGGLLATLLRFDPHSTKAAYDEVLHTAAPVLVERRLEGGIRNRELVLPIPAMTAPYLLSAHIFAAA
jgi:CheY-like chemotaxis protein